MKRRGDFFAFKIVMATFTVLVMVLLYTTATHAYLSQRDYNQFISNLTNTYPKAGEDAILVPIENVTPLQMSFKDFAYNKTTIPESYWIPVPFLFGKSIGVIPIPATYSETKYTQKIPIKKTGFEKIMKIANKTKVLFYDSEHIFIPAEIKGVKVVIVWECPPYAEIKSVKSTKNGIIVAFEQQP